MLIPLFETKSNILYHKSNPSFRDKIMKDGLKPMIGDSYALHYADGDKSKLKPAIFLCSNKDYDSTYDDDMWQIDASDLKFNKDEKCYDGCFICHIPIPADKIKLIYKGTGDSTL